MKMHAITLILSLLVAVSCQNSHNSTEERLSEQSDSTQLLTNEVLVEDTTPATLINFPPIDYDTSKWTELIRLDSTILLDLRYATDSNFVGEKMYDCGRCFLRPRVAHTLVKVHQQLRKRGLGLKMYDCYRPRPIQWKLWEKVPDRRYVSDPRKGSMHNRGAAVDLTIVDSTGQELPMGTPYDYFGIEAYPAYRDLAADVLANRALLHEHMKAVGFKPIRTEWWHFSLPGQGAKLSDMLWKCY